MKEYVGLILEESPVSCGDDRQATDADPQLCRDRGRVQHGKWDRCDTSEESFFQVRYTLTVVDAIPMHNNRYPRAYEDSVTD